MDKLDIILMAGVSLSILLFILTITFLFQFISNKKRLRKMDANKPKDRRKRRHWKKDVKKLKNKQSQRIRLALFSFIGGILLGGGTVYAQYYLSTNISDQDTDNIVYSYYLLNQMEEEIKSVDQKSKGKSHANIHTVAVSLSSFASKKGSDRGTKDAQILLNQYYAKIGQLGVNLSSQNVEELQKNKETQEGYLEDIKIVKTSQKKVIDYYKIDESSLKSKK